jgi:hypothetical protein
VPENGERTEADFQPLIAAVSQFVHPKIGDKLKPGTDLNVNKNTSSLSIKAKKDTHQQVEDLLRTMRAVKFDEKVTEPEGTVE